MIDIKKSQSLNSYSIFSELSQDHQQKIIEQTTPLSIKAGQTLIKEGDEADTLFFLQQGNLIVYSGEKPIAEISAGEPIGEIAFLTNGKRTATVIASRNCKLLELDQQTYNSLIKDVPELTKAIIQALAQRLISNNISALELEPKVSSVVAFLPAGDYVIPDEFIENILGLQNEITTSWKVLNANELDSVEQLTEWIQNNEEQTGQLILIASDYTKQPEIALAMSEHADKSFFVLENSQQNPAPLSVLEKTAYKNSVLNNVDLVILRKDNSIKITGTSKILNGRRVHLHHHVAINHPADLERLQRFIAGKAIGLVLCGGGALGSAHLGMIKSLQERGYNFDMVGGTSIGSAMSASYALGHTPDEGLKQMEDMFVKRKALGKYSIPFYSFLDHKHFDNEVKIQSENTEIEDLPINYFAVATNLSSNQLHVIRKGPLWEAIRSSSSIPGILPPFITKDGEVLIDGSIMDNTPIKTLRSLKSGPNVIMNFTPLKTWKIHSEYESIPRGLALLKQIILPKRKSRKYYPTIFSILSRTMISNSEQRFSEINQKDDIFLDPKRLPRMGMMNWKKSGEQFEMSYQQMNKAMATVESGAQKNKISNLRDAAKIIQLDGN